MGNKRGTWVLLGFAGACGLCLLLVAALPNGLTHLTGAVHTSVNGRLVTVSADLGGGWIRLIPEHSGKMAAEFKIGREKVIVTRDQIALPTGVFPIPPACMKIDLRASRTGIRVRFE